MTALHMEGPHANQEPVGLGGNQSRTSDRALRRMEKELKKGQAFRQDRHETRLDSDKASS